MRDREFKSLLECQKLWEKSFLKSWKKCPKNFFRKNSTKKIFIQTNVIFFFQEEIFWKNISKKWGNGEPMKISFSRATKTRTRNFFSQILIFAKISPVIFLMLLRNIGIFFESSSKSNSFLSKFFSIRTGFFSDFVVWPEKIIKNHWNLYVAPDSFDNSWKKKNLRNNSIESWCQSKKHPLL